MTERNMMTMGRSSKWSVRRPVSANAAALQDRPEYVGLLLHGTVCERYKMMILSYQTDRLDRDHKVLIFRRVE
jgi:hypothetical protein